MRAAVERRLWANGHEIADLYKSCRPAPLAASWVTASEES
jgi:hypothetical protein